MTSQPDQYDVEVFDSNSMDWLELPIEQLGRSLTLKPFTFDPDTPRHGEIHATRCLARLTRPDDSRPPSPRTMGTAAGVDGAFAVA